jgi:hypothetical protein
VPATGVGGEGRCRGSQRPTGSPLARAGHTVVSAPNASASCAPVGLPGKTPGPGDRRTAEIAGRARRHRPVVSMIALEASSGRWSINRTIG